MPSNRHASRLADRLSALEARDREASGDGRRIEDMRDAELCALIRRLDPNVQVSDPPTDAELLALITEMRPSFEAAG